MMHLGVFDEEPATVEKMDAFLWENGYENDMDADRMHHEIYLSDPRKTAPEKQRTVIRHPIRRAAGKTGAGDLPERPGRRDAAPRAGGGPVMPGATASR